MDFSEILESRELSTTFPFAFPFCVPPSPTGRQMSICVWFSSEALMHPSPEPPREQRGGLVRFQVAQDMSQLSTGDCWLDMFRVWLDLIYGVGKDLTL
jgi:hypothetical protein